MNGQISGVLEVPIRKQTRRRQLSKADRNELRLQSPLDHALYVAGIGPFDTTSVKAYMDRKIDALKNPPLIPYAYHELRVNLMMWGFTCLSLSVLFLNHSMLTGSFFPANLWAILSLISLVMMMIGMKGQTITIMTRQKPRLDACWECASVERYQEYGNKIPGEVLDTIKEVQVRLPQAELKVHYLYEDPFIEVIHRSPNSPDGQIESRFIAFWNEEGFVY